MAEVSLQLDSTARKILSVILKAVEKVGQNTIAEALRVDDSTVSGDKSKHWPRLAQTLAVAGMKVVPASSRCYQPCDIEPLLQLAKKRMEQLESVDQLQWDEH